jgi:signal transduction histidine kinase
MAALPKSQSLHQFFRLQAIKWSVVGLILTLLFAGAGIFFISKIASEKQIALTAQSTAKAFRTFIVDGHTRDAQLQIKEALHLGGDEYVAMRDPTLKLIYQFEGAPPETKCTTPLHFCWSSGFNFAEYLYPIYFDDQERELFGYMHFRLKPLIDVRILYVLVLFALMIFAIQAVGLSRALTRSAQEVTDRLARWGEHLKAAPMESAVPLPYAPFSELKQMQEAVDGLQFEIKKFQKKAADEAKASAQYSILREIGHDLKTPVSQLMRYFGIHRIELDKAGYSNADTLLRIERTISKIGNLLRQIRGIHADTQEQLPKCNMELETRAFLDDLAFDPEVIEKRIQVQFSNGIALSPAYIPPGDYLRIIENIIRNAIHAISEDGIIKISLREIGNKPTIVVRDNGSGIPKEIRDRIFDFDFTTKSSRGTGLGLGIVKRLCEEFGAQIDFLSEVGAGTEFKISFLPFMNQELIHEVPNTRS